MKGRRGDTTEWKGKESYEDQIGKMGKKKWTRIGNERGRDSKRTRCG